MPVAGNHLASGRHWSDVSDRWRRPLVPTQFLAKSLRCVPENNGFICHLLLAALMQRADRMGRGRSELAPAGLSPCHASSCFSIS